MAILTMIYGQSGTGKSTSLRNFDPNEVAVINVSGKPMPFRTKLQTYNTDDYNKILNALSKTERKSIVIDDATYLMVGEFMRNAKVAGYKIGGKTGTSEDGVNTGKYVTSFAAVAPTDDPELVMLITLYNPTGEGGHQGGGVAAPIGSQVLGEVLPYLEIAKDNESEENIKNKVTVPNIEGLTVTEAKKILEELNLNIELENGNLEEQSDKIIESQVPISGVEVFEESSIIAK